MALLKSYSCVKCGGVLNFDEGQEVFGCPFCGGEFAFTDFHRGDLLKQASSSLASGKYRTAADKYSTILNSNPRDFEALQGLVLSCGKIPSTDLFEQIDNLDKADFKGGVKAALDAKEKLKEEAEYFTLLADMFSAAGEYFQKKESYDEHTDRIRKGYREMILVSTGVDETVSKVMGIIGLSASVLWFVFFIASLIADNFWPLVIGLGALVVLILLVFVIAKIATNSTLKKKAEQLSLSQESDLPLSAEMNNYKFAYYVTYRDFKKLSPNADAYTVFSAKTDEAGKIEAFTDIGKTINCAKCGGQLKLDKVKGLYECRYCGIAYGTSLFFNDPLGKAEKALKDNDLSEADRRFSHVLMVEPSNPKALLGRILCAGFWENIHSIELVDEGVSDVVENNLKERTSEAVLHSNEEFKSFFEDIKKLTELYCEHENMAQEISRYDEKLEYYSRNWTVITAKPGAEPVIKKEQSKLLSKKTDASDKKNLIRFDFDRLKTKILRESIHLFSAKRWETDKG